MGAYKYLLYPCLTSACGTPSGGWHRSKTSWSNATSLPCGSSSKFFLRSGGRNTTNKDICRHLWGLNETYLSTKLGLVTFLNFPLLKHPPIASLSMSHSSWPLSHMGIGGTNHVTYYRLPGWFRDACLLPEGLGIKQKQLHYPSLLPSHPLSSLQHPPASSFHLYEGLEQPHKNKAPRRLDKSSCKPGWLHWAAHYVSLNTFTISPSPAIYLPLIPGSELYKQNWQYLFPMREINAGLFVFDESDRLLRGCVFAQMWSVRPGFRHRAKHYVTVLWEVSGCGCELPVNSFQNRCGACPIQSYCEKCKDKQRVSWNSA